MCVLDVFISACDWVAICKGWFFFFYVFEGLIDGVRDRKHKTASGNMFASCVGLIMFTIPFPPSFFFRSRKWEWNPIGWCYCSSGRFSWFSPLLCSARHWLQPCILVQLSTLCSAALGLWGFFSLWSSSTPTSFTDTLIANFGSVGVSGTHAHSPSPTQACTDTCISAHTATRTHIQWVWARRVWLWL